jgi:hypothetical protein
MRLEAGGVARRGGTTFPQYDIAIANGPLAPQQTSR